MDTLSHGLYGGGLFGRKNRKHFFIAFFFGIVPDIFSFGPYFVLMLLGVYPREDHSNGYPDPATIPWFVHGMYDVTHSIVIYAVVLALLWYLGKKTLVFLSFGWPLHIFVDVPTHTHEFFPTPFLWPISDITISGISWANPIIFIPNVLILIAIYFHWYIRGRRKRKQTAP